MAICIRVGCGVGVGRAGRARTDGGGTGARWVGAVWRLRGAWDDEFGEFGAGVRRG